ncbi:UDP-N-acetylmuramate dehydrogenase [Kingella negevensis]|uniref:UDP-N-acetylmuramate dehydrogenase n=1 Tax=Kingella negevensis TaxID=1522312 RepID=UPI00254333D4|nr:UDP-N-acetylmuramate dehydrogenase [Kingella negevensis]WII94247.1 UDP-N-acetylmuramate dehydrogenase [Kingella negevensis]
MFTLQQHHNLVPYTTFRLPAKAAYYTELTDSADLPKLCQLPQFNAQTVCWLGGGSNVLFMRDYPDLVVRMVTRGIREVSRSGSQVLIEAQAGEVWHDFVQTTLQIGLSGLENLSLIPGTVGASPVQNIGAYGVEVKDRIHSVECFDLATQTFITLSNADCQFAYRDSLFKHAGKKRYVITAVTFALSTEFVPHAKYGDLAVVLLENCGERTPTAQDVAQAVCQIRSSKLPDPAVLGNVGSFYKNPIVSAEHAARLQAAFPNMPHYPQADGSVKLAAGWLIDQCSLKGYAIGGAAVHEKQALVIVNQNHATADDVQALSGHICQSVWQKFEVTLHPEPNWLPEN